MNEESEKRYCRKCGKELIEEFKFVEYSSEDGRKLYSKTFVCPNRSWLFDGHSKYLDAGYSAVSMVTKLYDGDGTFSHDKFKWMD